jgi:hypothetical protein
MKERNQTFKAVSRSLRGLVAILTLLVFLLFHLPATLSVISVMHNITTPKFRSNLSSGNTSVSFVATDAADIQYDTSTADVLLEPFSLPAPRVVLNATQQAEVRSPKYLLYFTQGGWANQLICLRKAFIMAKLLDRVLLLPPVLPHHGKGTTYLDYILTKDWQQFKSSTTDYLTDPFFHYLTRLPKDRYLPMSQVIDVNYTLPGIQTMDVRNFQQKYGEKNLTRATIEIDYGFSHFNTNWLYNNSELEGESRSGNRTEYGKVVSFNRTYRDLPRTLGPRSEDVLVFLDSFVAMYSESVLAAVPEWRPRMAPSIREAVCSTIATWPPYVAIHVRTGDGPFKQRSEMTIRKVFHGVTKLILDWLELNQESLDEYNRTIGLYVATDLPNFRRHVVFAAEASNLTETIFQQHHVTLTLLSLENVGNRRVVLGGMLYADIFMDLEIPVCAPIGFQGSAGSTFSGLITLSRRIELDGRLRC